MLGYNLPNFQKNEEKQSVRELIDDVFKEQTFLTHDNQDLDKSVPREDQSVRKDQNVFTRLDKSTALL
jgi:hypothetical protein